jgi:nucleoside-diphosphate-sugar epimerase
MKVFITGESGTIPMAMQSNDILVKYDIEVVNNQHDDKEGLDKYKKHQSFSVRKPELDFTDRDLLFSRELKSMWENVDVIIHSGAFVGTDFCDANPDQAIYTNIQGTKNIVDLCNHYKIKLVYFSTTAIYDPNDYGKYKLITEDTKKNPQTLYGITKYSGEQIVDKLCKTDKIIIRPVFGFGNYPDDLHSALTKLIYVAYRLDKRLDILLNKNIEKSYTRVENIAEIVYKIICNKFWNDEFNVGCNESYNWFELFDIIEESLCKKSSSCKNFHVESAAIFHGKKDYLHWHQISTVKLQRDDLFEDSMLDIKSGIDLTVASVVKNINITPYWL